MSSTPCPMLWGIGWTTFRDVEWCLQISRGEKSSKVGDKLTSHHRHPKTRNMQIRSLKVPRGANVIVQGRLVEDTTPGLFVLEALTHWSCVCVFPSRFLQKFIKLQCWIERLWSQASVPMQCLFLFVLRIVWYVEVGKLEAWKIDKSWPDKVSATSCYCKWHVLRLCACFREFARNRECRYIRSVRPGGVILRASRPQ